MPKKNFKQINPAEAFITIPETETEPIREDAQRETQSKLTGTRKAPEGYKLNPEFIEVKSKRVQLLLQPSIVEALKALAKGKGLSMNETANEAIKEYLEREGNRDNGRY